MNNFEDEYYLLYPSDIKKYPLIFEDCHKLTCSFEIYKNCKKVPDCTAHHIKKNKIDNPKPFILDFFTSLTNQEVVPADCYMGLSLSKISFVVSQNLYNILQGININGVQYIPVTLYENNEPKFTDFWYVHNFNFLPVLSVKNSRYQELNGKPIRNNLLLIRFDSKKLGKISLENRLIFRFPLERSYFIFHISVVEKIMAANPIGIQFIQISSIDYENTDGIFL